MKTLPFVLSAMLAASAIGAAQTLDLAKYRIVDLSHAYGAKHAVLADVDQQVRP